MEIPKFDNPQNIFSERELETINKISPNPLFIWEVYSYINMLEAIVRQEQRRYKPSVINKDMVKLYKALENINPYAEGELNFKLKQRLGIFELPVEWLAKNIDKSYALFNPIETLKNISYEGYSKHSNRKHSRSYIIVHTGPLFKNAYLELSGKKNGPLQLFLELIINKYSLDYDFDTLIEDIRAEVKSCS